MHCWGPLEGGMGKVFLCPLCALLLNPFCCWLWCQSSHLLLQGLDLLVHLLLEHLLNLGCRWGGPRGFITGWIFWVCPSPSVFHEGFCTLRLRQAALRSVSFFPNCSAKSSLASLLSDCSTVWGTLRNIALSVCFILWPGLHLFTTAFLSHSTSLVLRFEFLLLMIIIFCFFCCSLEDSLLLKSIFTISLAILFRVPSSVWKAKCTCWLAFGEAYSALSRICPNHNGLVFSAFSLLYVWIPKKTFPVLPIFFIYIVQRNIGVVF